jgi:nucleoside-diphosphate-sugar epimerase
MNKKKYFITGGAGFLGSEIIKFLLRNNNQVVCYDNISRGSLDKLDGILKDIDFINGDIRDEQKVTESSKKCDSIIHLAFINGTEYFYKKPDLVLDVGIKGIQNILNAARKNNIYELILASSSEVYQTPELIPTPENIPLVVPDVFNPRYSYGAAKIISEILSIHTNGLFERMMIFRPHNVYGPNMGNEHVIPQLINRLKKILKESTKKESIDFPILGDGNQRRSFNYITDFAEGVLKIVNYGKHNNIYHIGDENEFCIRDIVQMIGYIFNIELKIKPSEAPAGETKRRCPDISKIKQLGYLPQVSLQEGLKLTVDWYCKN